MRRLGILAWLVVVILSTLVIAQRMQDGLALKTDFLALLPSQEETPWLNKANSYITDNITQRIVVLVKAESFEASQQASETIVDELVDFASLQNTSGQLEQLGKKLFPFRLGLLSDQDRQWLKSNQADKLSKRALAQIISPFSIADSQLIIQDPYLFLPSFLTSYSNTRKTFREQNGWTLIDDYIVLIFQLQGNAFDSHFQNTIVSQFDAMKLPEKTTVLKTGAVFYGHAGIQQGQREASIIGGLSILGIILLNLLAFRSLRPLGLSMFAVFCGLLAGLGMSLLIFDKLHILALVFGGGLVGICVDYVFHYCCAGFNTQQTTGLMRVNLISRPLTFGVISSSLGFLVLAISPFPGLQQIAVFATSGLLAAYLTVMYIFPVIDRSEKPGVFKRTWLLPRKQSLVIAGSAVFLTLVGTAFFHVDDDIRHLQSLPQQLKAEEQQIQKITGHDNTTQVLVVRADNEQSVLQLEEILIPKLQRIQKQGAISSYQSMSQIVPSIERQKDNRHLAEKELLGSKLLAYQKSIGMKPDPDIYQSSEYLKAEILGGLIEPFRLESSLHVILLNGVVDIAPLLDLAQQHPDVSLFDRAKSISNVLEKYRQRTLLLIGFACLLIWLVLLKLYGLKYACLVLAVPVSAVITTPFIAAAFGESFTFINAMALVIVLAVGLDYALFSHESSAQRMPVTIVANGLSAASTILAFGLLALSSIYAVHAFGITILIGIFIAYSLAPLIKNAKSD